MSSLLPNIKNILLVVSGKGGVGKTTVAVNLAAALAREGHKTGLLDADLYGPSVPLSLGLEGKRLKVDHTGEGEVFEPFEQWGIKVMSLGFLMTKEDAVIWRGPMASNVLSRLIEHTQWGPLDFLVIDMPPGTADIAITVTQKLPQSKGIVVITPQQMAVADGRKAARMLTSDKINIPILGIVENMSWFVPEKHPEEKYQLFGEGGGQQLADEYHVPLLAQIPMVSGVCDLGDKGQSVFASRHKTILHAFQSLAELLVNKSTEPAWPIRPAF
jgi:ATP-binding protein involved in chromosome partitioning